MSQRKSISLIDVNSVGGTSAVYGKSSFKQSKSSRLSLSNQKLARARTSTPKAIVPASRNKGYVMLLSNFGDENCGLSPVLEAGTS